MEPDSKNLISNRTQSLIIDQPRVHHILDTILCSLNLEDTFVDLSFVDADEIAQMNEEFRGKKGPTDVLSFPQWTWSKPITFGSKNTLDDIDDPTAKIMDPPLLLGDIVICADVAEKTAKDLNQPLEDEIIFLIIHSILHLCGHDHQTPEEEEVMTQEQRNLVQYLKSHGIFDSQFFIRRNS